MITIFPNVLHAAPLMPPIPIREMLTVVTAIFLLLKYEGEAGSFL